MLQPLRPRFLSRDGVFIFRGRIGGVSKILRLVGKTGASLLFFHLRNDRINLKGRGKKPLPAPRLGKGVGPRQVVDNS